MRWTASACYLLKLAIHVLNFSGKSGRDGLTGGAGQPANHGLKPRLGNPQPLAELFGKAVRQKG
jgi:hypothetical protein